MATLSSPTRDAKIARAAKEANRFLYELSGELATMLDLSVAAGSVSAIQAAHPAGGLIIATAADVAKALDHPTLGLVLPPTTNHSTLVDEGTHLVHDISVTEGSAPLLLCAGSDSTATLYAVYTAFEQLGVRFRIDSDVVPDRLRRASTASALLVQLSAKAPVGPVTPSFDTRGLQPFADFSAGPDWWNEQEFKLTFEQMAKMKLNFLGLHTYPIPQQPVAGPGGNANVSGVCGMLSAPEPTVWVGTSDDFDHATGQVTKSYQSTFFSTLGFMGNAKGGGLPMNTSDYAFGSGQAYPADAFSSKAMMKATGSNAGGIPDTMAQSNEIFNLVGGMQGRSFSYGRDTLGMKVAVGTEIPLAKPTWLQPSGSPPTTQEYYEAMFSRIDATYPIDFYWFWTPEGWEWSKVQLDAPLVTDAVNDLKAAAAAKKAVNASFDLATAGWVLGPMGQRNFLDTVLPPEFTALSSIEEELGWFPPDPSYLEVKRNKWTIPWMEDDGALGEPEFWVSRTIQHAFDARTMNINGLLGIHWRTREVSLQFSALALAPWVITPLGHGTLTAYDVYHDLATSDFGMDEPTAMQFAVLLSKYDSFNQLQQRPNRGTHSDVRMNGGGGCSGYSANTAMSANESLSYFGYVDEIAAFEDKVTAPADQARFDYWLSIYKFGRAEARSWALWGEFDKALDSAEKLSGIGCKPNPRSMCYEDTPSRILKTTIAISDPTNTMESCAASCGAAQMKLAGVEFGVACFCGDEVVPGSRPLAASACDAMKCSGNSAETCGGNMVLKVYNFTCTAPKPVPKTVVDGVMALRHKLLASVTEQINLLMRTVTTTGSLGTLSDFQQRGLPYMFTAYDTRLEILTGKPLPASAKMPTVYSGVDRLFVMSPRGSVLSTERYNITAMAFSKTPLGNVELYAKTMGEADWAAPQVLAQIPGRSVWEISLPPSVS